MLTDFGMIGLAVMGSNLSLNIERNGFTVSAYDIANDLADEFEAGPAKGKNITVYRDLKEFVQSIARPRRIMMMIRAGSPVDEMLDKLIPLLDKGDLVIDGGNSHFMDTKRRVDRMESNGMLFIGTGVSGGEEGALNGPALMPGGSVDAWPLVKPIFQKICAKAPDGSPCCDWIGPGGAGHFVKMVHNGIEYGDMQVICEAYDMMHRGLGLTNEELGSVFFDWNGTELNSYLIEITARILLYHNEAGESVVDKILDSAGQKGTGKWTSVAALDEGVPLTLISEAVYARYLSSRREERVSVSSLYPNDIPEFKGDLFNTLEDIRRALYASKIISYAQGFAMLKQADQTYNWHLDLGNIAMCWRGGCIIRSVFLEKIGEAYNEAPLLANLLMDSFFHDTVRSIVPAWRRAVAQAVLLGIPVPAFSAALSYFDGYTSRHLPANLLQAQRDYFGAHGYERVDAPRGEFFHTNWTGLGGNITSGKYNA